MKIYRRLLTWLGIGSAKYSDVSSKFYNSIYEISAWSWNEIVSKNDPTFIAKKRTGEEDRNKCTELFLDLYDEYLSVFGIGDTAKEYFKLKKKYAEELANEIITGQRFRENYQDIILTKIEKIESQKSRISFNDSIGIISKHYGFVCNPKKISYYDYCTALQSIAKHG